MAVVIQVAGSLLILAPFVLVQAGWLRTSDPRYIVPNLVGSAVLAVDAAIHHQWGFLLLESVWAFASLAALVRREGRKRPEISR